MRSRTIAAAASIAALGIASAPIAQAATAATSTHRPAVSRLDHSRDVRGVKHADRSPDRSWDARAGDISKDKHDR